MENSFEPTDEHITMLNSIDDETKSILKRIVDTLGYYQTIQVLIDQYDMTDSEAKILADIGCYMLD